MSFEDTLIIDLYQAMYSAEVFPIYVITEMLQHLVTEGLLVVAGSSSGAASSVSTASNSPRSDEELSEDFDFADIPNVDAMSVRKNIDGISSLSHAVYVHVCMLCRILARVPVAAAHAPTSFTILPRSTPCIIRCYRRNEVDVIA